MNIVGAVFKVAYALQRHRWLGTPLSLWFGLLLLVGGAVASVRAWPSPWHAVAFGTLFLVCAASLLWAVRWGYFLFEHLPQLEGLSNLRTSPAPLRAEEQVPVRVSGTFAVQGKIRYFVNVDAEFQTTALGEHIIMGRIPPSRFLLLGQWPESEVGWWYIFFRSEMIREMATGRFYFGLRSCDGLRLLLSLSPDVEQAVFLVSPDRSFVTRVQMHLLTDLPPEAVHGLPEGM